MIRVGVLRGGISDEYDVSLQTGREVISVLYDYGDEFKPYDILVTKDGEWYLSGVPVDEDRLRDSIDIVFNALHGGAGENGKTQELLEEIGIPYTGPRPLPAYSTIHKIKAKQSVAGNSSGLYFPHHYTLVSYKKKSVEVLDEEYLNSVYLEVVKNIPPPWVIKPVAGGSSVDVSVSRTREDLFDNLHTALSLPKDMMVEEYIFGREASVGVLGNYRGEEAYPLIPVEIAKRNKSFYDFEDKHSNSGVEICPGTFSKEEKEKLIYHAKEIHNILGMSDYSESNFIISPNGKVYFLETDSLPPLHPHSSIVLSMKSLGITLGEFVRNVILKTLGK
jgi:D-alanine-D-alanine ligase